MKSIDDFLEEGYSKPIPYRQSLIVLLKKFRDEVCPRCKKKKEFQKAWEELVKKVLYDKRKGDAK